MELFLNSLTKGTARIYTAKITMFLNWCDLDYTEFLGRKQPEALKLVIDYQNYLNKEGKKPATINNHLAALRSWIKFEGRIGNCLFSLEGIKGEKNKVYRDTSGVTIEEFNSILNLCDRTCLKGKRDYAIFRLLMENVLRRSELCGIDLSDYQPSQNKLWIIGKGSSEKEAIAISDKVIEAIDDYLEARRVGKYLFANATDSNSIGANSVYNLVKDYCDRAGIEKTMSPHRIRHSGLTIYLDATDGDIRGAQMLGRHSNINTTTIYDDNRKKLQGKASKKLSGLF